MRRLFIALVAIVALAIGSPALAISFDSFNQDITVAADSTLTVTEDVHVVFDVPRHGIFRDIPVKYRTDAGNPFLLRVKVAGVVDGAGTVVPYSLSNVDDRLRIKIGDANQMVIGAKTYRITYAVSRALLYMPDHDELYWNVVVEPWGDLGSPQKITTSIHIPGALPAASIRLRCFTAEGVGAPENCVKNALTSSASFESMTGYLTVVVGWPKGVVATPSTGSVIKDWFADNWIIFYPAVIFFGLFFVWWRNGRDPKITGPMVVQYDPPEKATPAEVGVLFDQKADLKDITATIVDLAVRGYLVIIESEEKQFIANKTAYRFELVKSFGDDPSIAAYEHDILEGIFGAGAPVGTVVATKDLEKQFYKHIPPIKHAIDGSVVERAWFKKSPTLVRGIWIGFGGGYLLLFAFFGYAFVSELFGIGGPAAFISVMLPGALIMFFGYFMPARTVKGTAAYAHALGFKEYLSKAEQYRLKWQEKEHIFETFLPYAMVFGVVDKWAKAFEGIATEQPSWYRGTGFHAWSPIYFANSLTSATSAIGHSLSVAPSSRGGGGFGGGGGGGGGFGGGGGGSW